MPRPEKPILTEWETRLLQILWEKGRGTASDIREILRSQGLCRSDSAIRKTLRVMEEKKAIAHVEEDRAYVYRPMVKREQAEIKGIRYLSRLLFGGSTAALALRALDEADLTPEIVEQLRQKLDEFES